MFTTKNKEKDLSESAELAIAHMQTGMKDTQECFEIAAAISRLKHMSNGKIAKFAFNSDDKNFGILIKSAYEFIEDQKANGFMPLDYTPDFGEDDSCDCEDGDECSDCENDEDPFAKIERLEEELEMTVDVLDVAVKTAQKIGEKYKELKSEYDILENGIKDLTAKCGR